MKKLAAHLPGYFKTATAPMSLSSRNWKAFPRRPKVILVMLLSVSLLLLLQSQSSNAQAPQQFSFQGVARDATGKILASKSIQLGFTIFKGSPNGNEVFSENHTTTTNGNGIFNIAIGSVSAMPNIDWGKDAYFLRTKIYFDGLSDVVDLGTTQLLSVPYSLFATKSNSAQTSITSDTSLVSKKWIDDEAVIQSGSDNSPLLPDVTNGNKLIWYPKKAAFRVGEQNGNWNSTNMGNASFATGSGTVASGNQSASFGIASEATGQASFAAGNGSKASSSGAFALGHTTTASAENSISFGHNSVSSANDAVSIGSTAIASGITSVAIGYNSQAKAANALAFGNGSEATGDNSTSFGNSTAAGLRSFAIGDGVLAKAVDGISIGTYNNSGDFPGAQAAATDRVFQLGYGTSADRSNAITVLRNGNIGIGDNALVPEYIMDFGGRPRIRHNGATAGIHFNNSQNQIEGFVGMKTDNQIGFYCSDLWQFWVDNTGAYFHGAALQASDKRLKTNIAPFPYQSLPKLNKLRGYNYKWLDPRRSQDKQTGLIAQEVETYFPELVATDKDGFKAVNYIGLIPHLIEAVKELDKKTEEIATLKKELASVQEMNKKLSALEASVKELLAGKAATSTPTSK
ncbi:MAG: tail fiber domain-containing protein [Dyadobacter sp.]|uniref:tail fiber domain-containing protein n=1 Tax=Dyadobacter sp. TaxID=1914288 RepID=UPI001B058830|nr:tail fiber domain-containing protein [Dyadobacter sp.]MBO9611996.1 tail fiber domain-containing protein [Dyadobacter sp.]